MWSRTNNRLTFLLNKKNSEKGNNNKKARNTTYYNTKCVSPHIRTDIFHYARKSLQE